MKRALLAVVLVQAAFAQTVVENDVVVLGFKLHYRVAGTGPAVVLLHGLGGDSSRWSPHPSPLAKNFHVIALDQIGFGQSDKPIANYHTGMLAEFLARFLPAIGVSTASLVGNSMGAAVALYTAVHSPQVVDRVVLADGGAFRTPDAAPAPRSPRLRDIQNGVTSDETREFLKIMFHNKSLVTDRIVEDNLILRLRSAYAIGKMQESGANGRGSLTEEEVRGVKAPTLIVWGKYDELADPAGADRLARAIRGSRKVLIDDCGHLPQLEKPAEFNRIVTEFLRSMPGKSPSL
jgi:2-hydroxy-6-oxonona-2,4-dienedioate hydrolase